MAVTAMSDTISITQREINHVGSRYTGEVSIATGKRHGQGSYVYPNPYFTYDGQWVNGQKHGQGKLLFGDGGSYEGVFSNGEIIGQGIRKWADGSLYIGEFEMGDRHGQGVYTAADGTRYEGGWVHNQYSGEGELMLSNGDHYQGAFLRHRFHGEGTLTRPAQDTIYNGLFEDGRYEGEGELTDAKHQFIYKGQFRAGHMDGFGKGVDQRSGLTQEGEWSDDKPAQNPLRFDIAEPGGVSYIKAADADETAAAPPELVAPAGTELPEIVLRVMDTRNEHLTSETGRCFKVTMYDEKEVTSEEGEVSIERRMVHFGDIRVPPEEKSNPSTPIPPDPCLPEGMTEEEAFFGEEVLHVKVEEAGELLIGGDAHTWLLPAYLEPGQYTLVIEDVTDITDGYLWERMDTVSLPVKVDPRALAEGE